MSSDAVDLLSAIAVDRPADGVRATGSAAAEMLLELRRLTSALEGSVAVGQRLQRPESRRVAERLLSGLPADLLDDVDQQLKTLRQHGAPRESGASHPAQGARSVT